MAPNNRIGLFHYNDTFSSIQKDFIMVLIENGFIVDLFINLRSASTNLVNFNEIIKTENVNVHIIEGEKLIKWYKKILLLKPSLLKEEVYQNAIFLSDIIIQKMNDQYFCFIGIEKMGLLWAGEFSEKYQIPLIYYSLELYIEDHPYYSNFKKLHHIEKIYHQKAICTIVQDEFRQKRLYQSNEIKNSDTIFLPVYSRGACVKDPSKSFFQQMFKLDKNNRILLYYGAMQKHRCCREIAAIAPKLSNTSVVFHGYGNLNYISSLKKFVNVYISTDLFEETKIGDIFLSVDIGISLYDNSFSNNRFTAFSSTKIALYLKYGIPIITFNNESYQKLFRKYRCGEMINKIDDLPIALDKIISNFPTYKKNAYLAYEEFYNLDNTSKELLSYLFALCSKKTFN
ncbi:MAG: hypothetical protein RBQ97_12205 [Acholeplasma sp.]|nr:hypothetical protein [Acholeplasma sp.]